MNELTRAAQEGQSVGTWQTWTTPILLGFLGLTSVGTYQQQQYNGQVLGQLNASVEEQNRLAEMRGTVQAELRSLNREVENLRVAMSTKRDKKSAREDFLLVKGATNTLSKRVDSKAEQKMVLELTTANRNLLTKIADFQERLVTQEQFQVLIGRVDALSKRVTTSKSK